MSIVDYTSLQSALKVWAVRPDSVFSGQIPTFIQACESRIYDGGGEVGSELYTPPLRSAALEVTGTVTMTAGTGALPSNALELRKVYVDDQKSGITYLPPERFDEKNENASAGTPVYYTVEAGQLRVSPAFTGTVNVLYWRRYDALTAAAPTNALVVAHGDIYLQGCLFEAFTFLQEGQAAAAYLARMRSAINGANKTAANLRYPGPMRVHSRLVFP